MVINKEIQAANNNGYEHGKQEMRVMMAYDALSGLISNRIEGTISDHEREKIEQTISMLYQIINRHSEQHALRALLDK